MTLAESIGVVAPYYNLAFVIVVVLLFLRLFKIPNKKIFLTPWKLLFLAVLIFIVEEILTVLKQAAVIDYPRIVNAVFEFFIITIFIYTLLIQKEYVKHRRRK